MMDADTKAALDHAADDAMRDYLALTPDALERRREYRTVLTDGVCRIREVLREACPPCVGYIWTDLCEKFPVFDIYLREQADALCGRRVKLQIQMSAKGTRYVTGMMALPVDTSTEVWPCPRCGGVARHHEYRHESSDKRNWDWRHVYACPVCHYQMEVGP